MNLSGHRRVCCPPSMDLEESPEQNEEREVSPIQDFMQIDTTGTVSANDTDKQETNQV